MVSILVSYYNCAVAIKVEDSIPMERYRLRNCNGSYDDVDNRYPHYELENKDELMQHFELLLRNNDGLKSSSEHYINL